MQEQELDALRKAIAALESQRATLGDAVLELAAAPLRARLAALQRPPGLQRRLVTVLFADVVGSTAMAQGLEAEDTLELLNSTLHTMSAVIESNRGRVLRFTGDGIKAAFGMDEAREDDAERAVRAGLALLAAGRAQAGLAQRLHGIQGFAVRVGVHTGMVALGAGVEADNTAMGATVNVAARMEQSAPPGTLRISHDTWSLVRGLFALEAQAPLQVKGVDAPMQTYLVQAALDRSQASVERGLKGVRTPLVGRAAELQRLLGLVPRARQTGQLQALTLLGEAGLGKSRLLRELVGQLGEQAVDCRLLTLRSQPDGMLRPWGLLRALLAAQCGVADTDSADLARRKVVAGLSPLFAERGDRQAQLIGQLSGLDFGDSPELRGLDPRSLRDQAFAAVRAGLQALAAAGRALPVLLVEDLHWADDGSLDLLQDWLAHAAELPLVLLMTARPTLLARRPDWGTPETTVTLQPLAATQGSELAQALLQHLGEVPQQLSALLVGRAEGNPYYMEELVRRLIDDGVIVMDQPHWRVQPGRLDSLRLPGTLVGLLQARLDALPARERQAARQASVIGHVFWDDALQALDAQAPQALPALQHAAFVRTHASSDFEGTPQRQFDHHLLHQVTYDTLLKAERRLGHGAAARWLAARTQGRGAEFLAMTGEHAERAGDTALAVDCFEQAGREACKRFANAAARSWLERAIALLEETAPARRFGLLFQLEMLADRLGDRPQQDVLHQQMGALLERHPDDTAQAKLLFCQALLADRRSDYPEAERLARQTFDVAQRCGAATQAALAQGELAFVHYVRGDRVASRAHVAAGLAWAARIDSADQRAEAEAKLLTLSAMFSRDAVQLDDARTALQAVTARGQQLGNPRLQIGALGELAEIARTLAQWDEMAACAERMHALAQAAGIAPRVAQALRHLGEAQGELGDHAAAVRNCRQAWQMCQACGDRREEAYALLKLGSAQFEGGETGPALASFDAARALFETLDQASQAAEALAQATLCEATLGRRPAAEAALSTMLQRLAERRSSTPHASIDIQWACYRALELLGDPRAEALLAQAHADVQARAAELTGPDDRERLIQAHPGMRRLAQAYRRAQGGPARAG